jgi:hypothetical protein
MNFAMRLACGFLALLLACTAANGQAKLDEAAAPSTQPAAAQDAAATTLQFENLRKRKTEIEAQSVVNRRELSRLRSIIGLEGSLPIEASVSRLYFIRTQLMEAESELAEKRLEVAHADKVPPTLEQLAAADEPARKLLDRWRGAWNAFADAERKNGEASPQAKAAWRDVVSARDIFYSSAPDLRRTFYIKNDASGKPGLAARDISGMVDRIAILRKSEDEFVTYQKKLKPEEATLQKLYEHVISDELERREIEAKMGR